MRGNSPCSPGSPEPFFLLSHVFELSPRSQLPSLSVSAHGGARCYPRLHPLPVYREKIFSSGKSCLKAAVPLHALNVPCSNSTNGNLISSSNKRAEEEIYKSILVHCNYCPAVEGSRKLQQLMVLQKFIVPDKLTSYFSRNLIKLRGGVNFGSAK